MVALLLLVVAIGVADSLNPTTIVPALYLATSADAGRKLAAFTAGAGSVYLVGGMVLMLGPGQVILAAVPRPGRGTVHLLEVGLGGVAVGVAGVLWAMRHRVSSRVDRMGGARRRSPFWLGAAIMGVELPTALPYFAAIAAIVASGRSVPTQILLLVAFNAAFALPLVGILGLRLVAGERANAPLGRLHTTLRRYAAVLIPAAVLIVGVALLGVGFVGLARG
jgi:cytochrome c biogenesis protein CcdA